MPRNIKLDLVLRDVRRFAGCVDGNVAPSPNFPNAVRLSSSFGRGRDASSKVVRCYLLRDVVCLVIRAYDAELTFMMIWRAVCVRP